jgi:hypothetical protein
VRVALRSCDTATDGAALPGLVAGLEGIKAGEKRTFEARRRY